MAGSMPTQQNAPRPVPAPRRPRVQHWSSSTSPSLSHLVAAHPWGGRPWEGSASSPHPSSDSERRTPVFFSGSLRLRHGDGLSSVAIATTPISAPEVAQRRRIDETTVHKSDIAAEQPMPPPPPPTEGRPGNICLYIVSFFLFVAILAGGAFFVLYITLPESENTIWFPLVGLALMATPWLFWTTTCLYRTITPRHAATERDPVRAAAAALPPAAAPPAAADAAPVDSPGGRGRVRFGAATVMEGEQEVPGGGGRDGGGHPPPAATNRTGEGDDGGSQATCRSQEDGSLSSHDSEMPLFRNR